MQATNNLPPSFTGESKKEAQEFLREFKRHTSLLAAPLTRAVRKKTLAHAFAPFVQEDTPAWEWWQALTPDQREDWEAIEALFNVEWTRPRAAQLELSERMALFRAKKLSREELETRVPISGTRDSRWRHSEYAEELERLGNKTGVQADLLVIEALDLFPPGVKRIMRKWVDQQQDVDWGDFCTHLGQLGKTAIDVEQESFDAQAHQAQLLQETTSVLSRQTEEIKQLKRAMAEQRSPSPTRGRGFGNRGLPAYASREPSPAGQYRRWGELEQTDVSANAVAFGRAPAPQTPRPPRTPQTPSTDTPRATSTPASAPPPTPGTPRPLICFRCGEEGHKVYGCTSTNPLPAAEQEALVASRVPRRQRAPNATPTPSFTPQGRRFWPPPTPQTPSPAERPRQVYYLDESYDRYDDADEDDYEAQVALAHVAFYGEDEGKARGTEE